MTAASTSAVQFGRLLTEIAGHLSDNGALPIVLSQVRDYLGVAAVVLRLERPGTVAKFYYDRGFEAEAEALGGLTPAALIESRQTRHVQARLSAESSDKRSELKMMLYRPVGEGDFDAEEIDTAQVILSLIARTLLLSVRLRHQKVETNLYSDALESLHVGVVLLTADGKVHTISPLARQMLLSRDGISASSGRLRAVEPGEDRSLQVAIDQVCKRLGEAERNEAPLATAARALALTKKSGSRGMGIIIRPMDHEIAAGSGAKVAVYIRDSEIAPDLQSEYVRQIFDLTPAEAAVTHRLTAGLSLEDAATSLQISRNTARAHLRSIFLKNGITRQTDLVRLVLNSAATICDARIMTRVN